MACDPSSKRRRPQFPAGALILVRLYDLRCGQRLLVPANDRLGCAIDNPAASGHSRPRTGCSRRGAADERGRRPAISYAGWLVTSAVVSPGNGLARFCTCIESQFAAVSEDAIAPFDGLPALAITCFDRGVMIKI